MKKKVLLPFEDHPFSLTYHCTAFPLGIVQSNATEDITPWLCGKYINCQFNIGAVNKFVHYISDNWHIADKILLQQRIALYPELYNALYSGDILFLFRKMLNLGYYPHGNYNEEFIPSKNSFQKEYYGHDFILIGYDDSKQAFISVGYLRDKKFQRYPIAYEDMRKAVYSFRGPRIAYNFWKYNQEAKYELNLSRLVTELSDYIQSITSQKININNICLGMQAIHELGNYIVKTCNEENFIDHRYTRGLMEHKFFMHMRIKYLLESVFLEDIEYLNYANKVYQMSERVHLLGVKYTFNGKQDIALHIFEIIENMLSIEKEYLPFVLSDLENKIGEEKI